MLAAGIKPDFISTDIHQSSIKGPVYDLPTCLNKFLALGMTLDEVIACATIAPARFLGLCHEIGSLRKGSHADVAVFRLSRDPVELFDVKWTPRTADQILQNRATFIAGRLLPRLPHGPDMPFMRWKRGGRYDANVQKREDMAGLGHVPKIAPPLTRER